MTEQMILDKMDQLIRLGFVNARMPEKMRVKVTLRDTPGGPFVTDWLPVLSPRASGDMQYDLPDVGDALAVGESSSLTDSDSGSVECLACYLIAVSIRNFLRRNGWSQVLCVFLAYGLEQGFVVGAMYGRQVPPVQNADKWHRAFRDGTTLEYDRAEHKLTAHVKGDCELTATGSVTMKAQGPITLEAPTVYVRGTLVNTASDGSPGKSVFSGGMEVLDGGVSVPEGDVIASGVSLTSHTTDGVMPGGGVSGVPTGGSAESPGTGPVSPDSLSENEKLLIEDTRLTILKENMAQNGSEIDQIIACLPQITAAVARRQKVHEDKEGWLYLNRMLRRWLTRPSNKRAEDCTEPFWIDWEWVMSYKRAAYAYALFIDPAYEQEQESRNIYSRAALDKLGEILCREKCLDPEKKEVDFDFTQTDWRRWEALYFSLRSVPRIPDSDGLMAALAGFTLRALAAGKAENLGNGRWRITVTRVAVYVHDIFNFEEDDSYFGNYLCAWSCAELDWTPIPTPLWNKEGYFTLKNKDFRSFQDSRGYGSNFLVLSQPHTVENFHEVSYETICA